MSPVSEPSLSYVLPHKDASVRLHWAGSGRNPLPLDRTLSGFHHMGDVTLRTKRKGETRWSTFSTVDKRGPWTQPVCGSEPDETKRPKISVDPSGRFVEADVSGCLLPAGAPLGLRRRVAVQGHEASVEWTVTNTDTVEVTLGAFGAAMPFNQMFTGRTLSAVSAKCSFTDPYIGGGGGYVQVTRASGEGPVLLVLPEGGGGLEGWRPLKQEDRANYDWMHEMLYETLFHSAAYAQEEWRTSEPWLPPTEATLAPGASATFRARFRLAPHVERVSAALLAAGRPVAVPLPSATFHRDSSPKLHVLLPPTLSLESTTADPAALLSATLAESLPLALPAAAGLRLHTVALDAGGEGRMRVALRFKASDTPAALEWRATMCACAAGTPGGVAAAVGGELVQWVSLMVLPPARDIVNRYGRFQASYAYLNSSVADPWHRSPAFFGYDADKGDKGVLVDEVRVFMAGGSDESGAAAPLSMAVKQLGQPSPDEIEKLEAYVHETLWAGKDLGGGGDPANFLQNEEYAVRASMLYWSDALQAAPNAAIAAAPATAKACQKCWPKCYWMHCWSEKRSRETWRAYNYPHVATTYWALYRLGRHFAPPLTRRATWQWYLKQAGRTVTAMWRYAGKGRDTSQWGLMVKQPPPLPQPHRAPPPPAAPVKCQTARRSVVLASAWQVGSAFQLILDDLEREGFEEEAAPLRKMVEQRLSKWSQMVFPYGSEFPWDSTGQEEINTWLIRSGKYGAANKTVGAVLAYSSLMPHWAYCGSARRYWDFVINGKLVCWRERGGCNPRHGLAAATQAWAS